MAYPATVFQAPIAKKRNFSLFLQSVFGFRITFAGPIPVIIEVDFPYLRLRSASDRERSTQSQKSCHWQVTTLSARLP